jgi:hypothetical protein
MRDLEKQKQRKRESYLRNKEKVKEASRLQRIARRKWLDDLKAGKPCADCGQTFPPRAMDFHHTNGVKEAGIGDLLSRASRQRILDEIEKCVILCATCHRLRH